MAECRDLEPLFAAYVDGEAQPRRSRACRRAPAQPARRAASASRASGRSAQVAASAGASTLRACRVGRPAPPLRERGVRPRPAPPRPRPRRRGASDRGGRGCRCRWPRRSCSRSPACSSTAERQRRGARGAARVDHVKCFQFAPAPTLLPDAQALGARVGRRPAAGRSRCRESAAGRSSSSCSASGAASRRDGTTAHIMYKWRGAAAVGLRAQSARTRSSARRRGSSSGSGRKRSIWSTRGRTYAVVARGRAVGHRARRATYVQRVERRVDARS